jgi:hypothetical protein
VVRKERVMEGVEGLMHGLKLSEEERAGVKIGTGRVQARRGVNQAVGKLLAEKPAHTEAICNALGPIWCPMKGIEVKDLGENIFLFTFLQPMGKKKAEDSGPWMFDKDLLVLEEFDAGKTIDEYEFNKIPIWFRVFNLPLGRMDGVTGELIGNQVGDFMEVDGLVDGMAVGQFLRVKVRLLITKPLMRGTMVEVGSGKRSIWCRFEYEYCPDFCFICGIIGHVDKECSKKLVIGEEAQFGKWLKWVPPKRSSFSDGRRGWNDGSGRRMGSWGSGGGRRGSDAPSWKKSETISNNSSKNIEGEKKVCSPLKITDGKGEEGRNSVKEPLVINNDNAVDGKGSTSSERSGIVEREGKTEQMDEKGEIVKKGAGLEKECVVTVSQEADKNSAGRLGGGIGMQTGASAKQQQKKYKKIVRSVERDVSGGSPLRVGVKRSGEVMEVDELTNTKKGKGGDVVMSEVTHVQNLVEAGLSK